MDPIPEPESPKEPITQEIDPDELQWLLELKDEQDRREAMSAYMHSRVSRWIEERRLRGHCT